MEAEVDVYKMLQDSDIAPRLLGHVTEGDRVIGFLAEYISYARKPLRSDTQACLAVLKKLQKKGITHGDTHSGNLLMRPDGSAMLIDFELSVVGKHYVMLMGGQYTTRITRILDR
jgi:RIO-like serine/threonine protein kinase